MELEVFDIIVFVTGIIVGFVGALIFRALSKKSTNDKHQAGAAMEAMQHEMERRQVLADDHFLQLNAHLAAAEKKLADARKAVFDGASTLATVELEKPEVTDANNGTDSEEVTAPPRDYAAKSGNDEGTLSENYGLHRKAEEEPSRAAY